MRYRPFGIDYWVAISYRLGFVTLFKFGGVYMAGTCDGSWAESGKQVPSHEG